MICDSKVCVKYLGWYLWIVRFINGGHLLNGLAGPVCMSAPPLISATWFPASQRTTATSLALLSGNVGFALGFVLGNVYYYAES